jgi:glycosyltransferase involved in cell wall biosynthesis/2-polyprenyl-3-methyl-5-hydroxy-6-metoxy-1,4-benzoquinol methylase
MEENNMNPPDLEAKPKSNSTKERVGLGIGIITRGWVSIKWMMHMEHLKRNYPIGIMWKYLVVEGRSWAEARTEIVHKARAMNFEWLLFIDDDVFLPEDGINRLFSAGKKIITGMYWTKTEPPRPVIFKRMGDGPYDSFPLDEVIEVAGAGLGCCLIHMSVFDQFDKASIPYFLENWIYTDPNGVRMKCPVGEDHYFYTKSKELGFKVWCDTGCLCDHFDYKGKRFFPGEKIVREIAEQKLRQVGRTDIIETHKKSLGVDSNKKTICFFNATANPFAGNELEKRGIGGSEGDVINLSRIFSNKFGFNVHVFANCDEPGIYDNVIYHDIKSATPEDIAAIGGDLFILSRNVDVIRRTDFHSLNAKKVCLWTHDLATDPVWKGIETALPNIDKIFALTDWHRRNIMLEHKIPKEKFFLAKNGVDMNRFKGRETIKKIPGKCIYSSTPFRGLDILIEVWPEIKRRVPHAELYIFSSMKVYGPSYDDDKWVNLYEQAKKLPGVHYFGTVKHDALGKHFMESELLTYPNTYDETCCITVLEAQSAGTPIVTSAKAALNETVPDDVGIKIEGNPYSKEYKEKFIESCVELLTNKDKWQKMHEACFKYDYSWATVSDEWINEFFPEEFKKFKGIEIKSEVKPKEEHSVNKNCQNDFNTPDYWDIMYGQDIASFKEGKTPREDVERYELMIQHVKAGEKVLDIGCGMGYWTRFVRKKFPINEIWGTDISMKAIDFCREMDRSIFYANHPMENTDQFEQQYFDVITAEHVIEHFKDPKELIIKMRKLVKGNGKIMLVIPINDEPWREHPKIWQMKDVYELIAEYFKNDEVSVQHRFVNHRRYSDGRPFEESVIVINLKGGK